jgi:uncharacterized protein YjiS (DUF1127 family)
MTTPSSIIDARPWPFRLEREVAGSARRAGALAGMARLVVAVLREYRARRAVLHLSELDDRLLRDVGLGRGGIERAVRTGRPPGEPSGARA